MEATWFVLGTILGEGTVATVELMNPLIDLVSLVGLVAGAAMEAGTTVRRSCEEN